MFGCALYCGYVCVYVFACMLCLRLSYGLYLSLTVGLCEFEFVCVCVFGVGVVFWMCVYCCAWVWYWVWVWFGVWVCTLRLVCIWVLGVNVGSCLNAVLGSGYGCGFVDVFDGWVYIVGLGLCLVLHLGLCLRLCLGLCSGSDLGLHFDVILIVDLLYCVGFGVVFVFECGFVVAFMRVF